MLLLNIHLADWSVVATPAGPLYLLIIDPDCFSFHLKMYSRRFFHKIQHKL